MQQLGQYVVSLTSVALISGILLSLVREGPTHTFLRLLTGILMIITALPPLTDVTVPDLMQFASDYLQEGNEAAEQGNRMAKEERILRIKEALEEYIYDKASALGEELCVSACLDESGNPVSVQLIGSIDSKARQELQTFITKELGIRKENQEWIGQTRKMP